MKNKYTTRERERGVETRASNRELRTQEGYHRKTVRTFFPPIRSARVVIAQFFFDNCVVKVTEPSTLTMVEGKNHHLWTPQNTFLKNI